MIIDTYVEEICTLCGEENTSGSLLVLRLPMYTFTCVVESLPDKVSSRNLFICMAMLFFMQARHMGIHIHI